MLFFTFIVLSNHLACMSVFMSLCMLFFTFIVLSNHLACMSVFMSLCMLFFLDTVELDILVLGAQ